MKPISILIVDDHVVIRKGLRTLIEERGWRVVGEAANGREAVDQAARLQPDLVVMDLSMPVLNGLDATPLILKTVPHVRILILTMHNTEELVQKTLQAGGHGYVLKSDAERDLVTALEAVLQNHTFFTPAVSGIMGDYMRHESAAPGIASLSPRERQIVQLLAEGGSNKEVAASLGISTRTVENHRARIMRKLQLRSLSDLVRHAIRNKIIQA